MPTAKKHGQHQSERRILLELRRLLDRVHDGLPSKPAIVAPMKIATGSLDMFQRKPIATPGRTAWERASPTSAILRTTMKAAEQAAVNPEQHRTEQRVTDRRILKGEEAQRLFPECWSRSMSPIPARPRRCAGTRPAMSRRHQLRGIRCLHAGIRPRIARTSIRHPPVRPLPRPLRTGWSAARRRSFAAVPCVKTSSVGPKATTRMFSSSSMSK